MRSFRITFHFGRKKKVQQSRLASTILVLILVLGVVTFFVLSSTEDTGAPPKNVSISNAKVSSEIVEKTLSPKKEIATQKTPEPVVEEATPPPATSRDVEVQVVSVSEHPIVGASIKTSSGLDGVTDEGGLFSISVEDSEWPVQIDVVALGFDKKRVESSMPKDGEKITVFLKPLSDAIHGRVVTGSEQKPAGSGIYVVAWPKSSRTPSWRTLRGLLESESTLGLLLTETDDGGQFLFERLDATEKYSIIAGGNGLSTQSPTEDVSPGSDDVVLTTIGLFGAALRFTETGRIELRNDNGVRGVHFVTSSEPGLHRVTSKSSACTLNGFLPDDSPNTRLLFFLKDTEEEEIGPLQTVCAVPGYNKHLVRFVAHRASNELTIQDVELTPFGDRIGTIEVVFDGWSGTPSPESSVPAGEIHLANHSTYLRYPIKTLFQKSHIIDGVPQGFYNVAFQTSNGLPHRPKSSKQKGPVPLHVTDEIAKLPLEVSHLGALGITIKNGSKHYDGRAWIYLMKSHEDESHRHAPSQKPNDFHEPPYVIEGIPFGTYDVSVHVPGGGVSEPASGSWEKLTREKVVVAQQSTKWVEIDVSRN